MGKLKQPLLSLHAKGTLADTLTFQKSAAPHIVRSKPRLPYFLTLPTQYQRWFYQDYAYLWRQQSQATRDTYRSAGVRHHLTGFQYWMKYQLTNLPDLLGFWKLDEKTGAIAHDSSRYAQHATIIGASPTTGVIAGGYSFDGINDRMPIGNPSHLTNLTQLSIIIFYNLPNKDGIARVMLDGANYNPPYGLQIRGEDWSNDIVFKFRNTLNVAVTRLLPYTKDVNHSCGVSWDGSTLTYYMDGIDSLTPDAFTGTLACTAVPITIGSRQLQWYMEGMLDNVLWFSRPLDATEHLRWAERRYPP